MVKNILHIGTKLHIVFHQIGATNKFHIYNVRRKKKTTYTKQAAKPFV